MHDLEHRISAACAFFGCVLLGIGISMHPKQADPSNAAAAFAEYAADTGWITAHLLQFGGAALLVGFLLLLARETSGPLAFLRPVAAASATASLVLAAALQAVDGIALKASVDAWAAASTADKPAAFAAAFALRQIEIGLAALLSIVFGATAALFGAMLYREGRYPMFIGVLAVASGVGFAAGGLVMAYNGFSSLAIDIQMPASLLMLAWIVAIASIHWRRATLPPAPPNV
jgi:hypothetical protein